MATTREEKKKTISTGTLNLRFMQRAAGGAETPALQKKEVVDEGSWDIGPEMRRALGLEKSTTDKSEGTSSVSYESSYIPFVGSSASQGRSRFNKYGVRKSIGTGEGSEANSDNEEDTKDNDPGSPSKDEPSSQSPVSPGAKDMFLRPGGIDEPTSDLHKSKRLKVSTDGGSGRRHDAGGSLDSRPRLTGVSRAWKGSRPNDKGSSAKAQQTLQKGRSRGPDTT
ncbi:uncharacterized protein EI90DRAFT_3013261 [Cantharellus anzutake]|uniref:uncharacterized protein n=1 Tax=Cantharellus anzutake TaxID=1750568 RepID=UPI001906644B|nr:uncharacterized protein EI90DRAFT_3013261 [Cantharellus anzutake]KAF8337887.1 hypothetical protein EI90DRAFT_3013261 [Cantharellus anzutake]